MELILEKIKEALQKVVDAARPAALVDTAKLNEAEILLAELQQMINDRK